MAKENIKIVIAAGLGLLGAVLAAVSPFMSWSAAGGGAAAILMCISVVGGWRSTSTGGAAAQGLIAELKKNSQTSEAKLRDAQTQLGDMNLRLQLLLRRKNSTEAILHSIHDAVIVTDDRDQIILANNAAEKLFGFRFDPKEAMPAADLFNADGLMPLIQKSRSGRIGHVRHELSFQREGVPLFFDAVLSCTEDGADHVCAIVTVLHDVTREKETAQIKNDFVSHVSHELKTPLASINAYAEMLVDGEAKDEQTLQQFCSVIQGQAQRLTRLIDDILNISRIESGLIKVKKENNSVALVIHDAVEMIKSYAQEKNITLDAQAPILYDQVHIDRDMISQVVINLLSNAVKYTPAGGSVTVRSEVNETDNRIIVTIADTGVGIPAEAVDHVFDKFYRVEANNKYAKGTGLGLNLVKQIVETVHGGRVFVTSTPGKGSTFGFELPLAAELVSS